MSGCLSPKNADDARNASPDQAAVVLKRIESMTTAITRMTPQACSRLSVSRNTRLASRIDTLAASTRSVAMQAAVVGRQFEVPLLAEVVGDREPTTAALVDLESHGVIKLVETRPRLAYRFRHALNSLQHDRKIA